ncbi:MAG TPA: N-acetyltransferase, partial [Fervidobacterium sp.]|nr:N-acetyltransferase [Fervidobacterium sp.]
YFVWGKSGKESAFIVDLGIMSGALENVVKAAVEYIVAQTGAKLISIVAVPENDALYEALCKVGFRAVLSQYEMCRKL